MSGKQVETIETTSLQHWRIGEVTITKFVEAELVMDLTQFFPDASEEEISALPWLKPHFVTDDWQGILSFHALVIDTPDKRIIVDTCVGNERDRAGLGGFHMLQTSFLRDLESAGFARESFDTVLCTHLHVDHVGWNTMLKDGNWVPTFPNARYLLNKVEYEYWSAMLEQPAQGHLGGVQDLAFLDAVQPIVDAGLVELVEGAHRVCDEVWLEPTVGHSPGHVSVRVSSRGENALITGDMIHHPCQLAHVDWGLPEIDFDTDQASQTRRRVFSEVADSPVLVIGTHWAGATAGKVKRADAAYRLEC